MSYIPEISDIVPLAGKGLGQNINAYGVLAGPFVQAGKKLLNTFTLGAYQDPLTLATQGPGPSLLPSFGQKRPIPPATSSNVSAVQPPSKRIRRGSKTKQSRSYTKTLTKRRRQRKSSASEPSWFWYRSTYRRRRW